MSSKSGCVERVSYQQWQGYAKRLEKQNLKQYGSSLSFSSIASSANSFVVELMDDYEIIIAKPGWREAMAAASRPKS